MIVPTDFKQAIKAGDTPQIQLYLNGSTITAQQSSLLQEAITNYARLTAHPQPPLKLVMATINADTKSDPTQFLSELYKGMSLLLSFLVGLTLMPNLLIEEKEKKTLRMLMVTPATFSDVVLGKLLTTLLYQLVLSFIILFITGGPSGNIALVLLYILLGATLALSGGLLIGTLFQTSSSAGAFSGLATTCFFLPTIFGGPLGELIGRGNIFQEILHMLPTYYLTDGLYGALQAQSSLSTQLLDIGITLGSTLVLLLLAAWFLRHQARVAVAI
ncbi:ABC transporter permease [Ktedonosporobacter rubrisoli]|uniref:ABC transporter permease n=1 Tax=Ktedonosporobacter rubrisoli TaxID=2509675 RepID=UPI00241434E8|nr:ABC transporter permease [Ktedonosporobacter rubrisoli]